MKHSNIIKTTSDFIYYFISFHKLQSLGEEFSDVMMIHHGRRPTYGVRERERERERAPAKLHNSDTTRRMMLMALLVSSPALTKRLLSYGKKRLSEHYNLDTLESIEAFILGPLFTSHLALFYFTSAYYQVSRRILGMPHFLMYRSAIYSHQATWIGTGTRGI
jgi:hypothetical protein